MAAILLINSLFGLATGYTIGYLVGRRRSLQPLLISAVDAPPASSPDTSVSVVPEPAPVSDLAAPVVVAVSGDPAFHVLLTHPTKEVTCIGRTDDAMEAKRMYEAVAHTGRVDLWDATLGHSRAHKVNG